LQRRSGGGDGLRPGHHAHHAGIHLRRRVEGIGRHVEQFGHVVVVLQKHRQPPHVTAGRSHDAVHHLLLQHEMLVFHAVGHGNQVQQQRAGDVVGQIADNAQFVRPAGGRCPCRRHAGGCRPCSCRSAGVHFPLSC
jgi:hypothetical protein